MSASPNAHQLAQVIGGGTAGNVVANRLASVPGVSVAVVEAGSFYEISNGNSSQVPAYDVQYSDSPTAIQPLIDWGITTEPQPVRINSTAGLSVLLLQLPRFHIEPG